MALELHQFTVTVPPNTPKATPYVAKMPLNLFDIERIDLDVPPGPSGLMGFYLALSGQQWLPWEQGEWFVWDDKSRSYPLINQPTSSGWELHAYNLDVYQHAVYVGFNVNLTAPLPTPRPPTITIVQSASTPQLVPL